MKVLQNLQNLIEHGLEHLEYSIMANLSNQIKAFLISKGKTNDEINSLFYSEKILLESIDEIVEIKTWTVTGITKPTINELNSFDTAATKIESTNKVIKNRVKNYPSLTEQLDMQYWDSINGTTKWKDLITKIKNDNPKPS